jgi:hypothetical protein
MSTANGVTVELQMRIIHASRDNESAHYTVMGSSE